MIGGNIKRMRVKRGLTQFDVVDKAKEIGADIKQAQLSIWENGKRIPNDVQLDDLCKIFKCKKEELTREDSSKEYEEAYREGYNLGIKFKPEQIEYIVRKTAENVGYEKKVDEFMSDIINLVILKALPAPNVLAKLIIKNEDDKPSFLGFVAGFWNGSLDSNNQ